MSTPDHPKVISVVTNWNGYADTVECVASVLASTYANSQVVIVDNGSTDGCAERLAARFPAVPQVQTGFNGAVTAAYNAGVRYALAQGADYVLMLNNDTTLAPEMIGALVDAAEKDANIGVVTPKIYYYDRPDVIWFAGAKRHSWDFGAYDKGDGDSDTVENSTARETDFAWACGMLFRRALLEEIGLFDTRFFLYYDDVDMCVRTHNAGYKIWYEPAGIMWHKVSGSTGSARFARTWARSKVLLFRKHTRGLHRLSLLVYAVGHAFYRRLRPSPLSRKMNEHFGAYLHGLWEGLIWREERAEQGREGQ